MRLLALVAIALALAACQHAAPAPAPQAPESAPAPTAAPAGATSGPIHFVFGWQPGLRARLVSTRTRTRELGPSTTQTSKGTIEVRVEAQGDGLLVRLTEPTLELPNEAGVPQKVTANLADLVPDYLVTREGEFSAIRDLPAFQERVRSFLRKTIPEGSDPEVYARAEKMMTSEELLTASAAQQWNTLVGLWVGGEMDPGTEYTQTNREPVPVLPGQEIQMNYTFATRQRVPCERSGQTRECADVEMRAVSDPADTARAVESVLAGVGGAAKGNAPVFHSLNIETRIELRTEPQGLFPHSCVVTKTVRGTIEAQGEQADFGQVDRTEMLLEYP